MTENKKRVAEIYHANGIQKIVFDNDILKNRSYAPNPQPKEFLVFTLGGELQAIIPTSIFIKIYDYIEPPTIEEIKNIMSEKVVLLYSNESFTLEELNNAIKPSDFFNWVPCGINTYKLELKK